MPNHNSRIFTVAPWEKLDNFIKDANYSSIFLLCDENTSRDCKPLFQSRLPELQLNTTCIQAGEQIKNLDSCNKIYDDWLNKEIDRNSLVICLGGGVITDIGGYCASTILRGVDCVYIPTSLMAMADASIGGKTGVNFNYYKNQIGTFTQPKAIVIEPDFLRTLSDRHLKNGFVEIIKHSLLQSPSYFQDLIVLQWPLNESDLIEYTKKSIRTKTDIVEKDITEKGIRKCLNFGHTIGHALESYFLQKAGDVLHGEAIAAGMICESYISSALFKWKTHLLDNIKSYLKPFTHSIQIDESTYEEIIEKLEHDKKKKNKSLYFSLLEAPGKPALDKLVSPELILDAFRYL